jgi:hypothetical protein
MLAGFGLFLSSCGSSGSRLVSVDPGSPSQLDLPAALNFVVQIGSSYGDPVVVDVSDPLLVTVRLD